MSNFDRRLTIAWTILAAGLALTLERAVLDAREAARASACLCKPCQFGLAIMNYLDSHGTLPPPYTRTAESRRARSWREIVPLEGYGRGDLDPTTPWDEAPDAGRPPAPPMYFCPSGDGETTRETDYVAVVGPETAWPEDRPMKITDIRDDLASTILVLETVDSGILWNEPRDPTLDEALAAFGRSRHRGFVHAFFADGRTRRISTKLPRETLRAMLTADGGERVDVEATGP